MDEDSVFFLLNSYTTGLQPAAMSYMLSTALKSAGGKPGSVTSDEIGVPVTSTGLVLPCGASSRWER